MTRLRLIPGAIPDGWTPGDFVHVIAATPGTPGAVVHTPLGLERALMDEHPPGSVALVRYAFEETPDLSAWLAWWNDQRKDAPQ